MTSDAYCYVITCNILVCKLNKLEFHNKKGNINCERENQQSRQQRWPLEKKCLAEVTVELGCVQTDATTSNIVAPTMLGVVASVLAVVCKRMQQFPTMLRPTAHRGKDTTHKTL